MNRHLLFGIGLIKLYHISPCAGLQDARCCTQRTLFSRSGSWRDGAGGASSGQLVTSNYVFDELVTILRCDFGHKTAAGYGERLRESKICTVARLAPQDEERAWEIFLKYSDQDFSFTDCTSFAFMERLGIKEAAAFDSHFEIFGFVRLPAVPLVKT